MFRSTTVVFALAFLLVALVDGHNKNINYSHYRNCSHEYRHIGRRDGRQYPDFTNFLKLSSFKYGICEDEIHLRFYFKGDADFHVLFTKHRRLPEPNEKMFNVWLGYYYEKHAIYYNHDVNERCDFRHIKKRFLHEDHFTQVDIVLDKLEGKVTVAVPGERYPFLSCYDSDVKDMDYISFTSWDQIDAIYYIDCDF